MKYWMVIYRSFMSLVLIGHHLISLLIGIISFLTVSSHCFADWKDLIIRFLGFPSSDCLSEYFFFFRYSSSCLFLSFLKFFILVADRMLLKNLSVFFLVCLGESFFCCSLIFCFLLLRLFHSLILRWIVIGFCLIHLIGSSLFLVKYLKGLLFRRDYQNCQDCL